MKQIILTAALVAVSTLANARSILPVDSTNTFIIEASERTQLEVVLVEEKANTSCDYMGMTGINSEEIFEVEGNVYVPTVIGYRLQPAGYFIAPTIECDPKVEYPATDIRGSIVVDVRPGEALKIVTPSSVDRIEVNPVK